VAQALDKETVDLIRNLLARIPDGREKVNAAAAIITAFNRAKRRADFADGQLAAFAGLRPPREEELLQRKNDHEKLKKKAGAAQRLLSKRWDEHVKALGFMHAFANDVESLTRRFPPSPPWIEYARALMEFRIRREDAWALGTNSDVSALELRLRELLDPPRSSSSTALPPCEGHLTERDERIARFAMVVMGDEAFLRFRNPEIINRLLPDLRKEPGQRQLTRGAVRATLNRIRKARGYPSSENLRNAKAK
jgi:hypothetical protein